MERERDKLDALQMLPCMTRMVPEYSIPSRTARFNSIHIPAWADKQRKNDAFWFLRRLRSPYDRNAAHHAEETARQRYRHNNDGRAARPIREVEQRPEISAMVFSGDGKCFSAGVDIAAHTPEKIQEMLSKFTPSPRDRALSKDQHRAVHRNCLGAARNCHGLRHRLYHPRRHMGLPGDQLACYPPVACAALAALVGQNAQRAIVTGDTFNGPMPR